MAHTKLLVVHSTVLTTALEQYLGTQTKIHPAVAGSLMTAVQAHLSDDPELKGLPPDAHIVGHAVSTSGQVSLIIESQTFPWTPDGLPLAKMPVFAPLAVPAASAAPAPAGAVSDAVKVAGATEGEPSVAGTTEPETAQKPVAEAAAAH